MQHDTIKFSFSQLLRHALRRRFGKMPSNAVIAREFNLRCHGAKTISQESVRRWLLGATLPEYSHLEVLVRWLDIDTNLLFQPAHSASRNSLATGHPDATPLPELQVWNRQLNQLSQRHRQPLIQLIDNLLSLSLERIEKTYIDFSEMVSSTRAARAAPAASESTRRTPTGNNATFEKTVDYRSH